MSRLIDTFSQFFDGNGNPLSNGYLQFFENETAIPLSTYNDDAQTIINPADVPLDGEGRLTLNVYASVPATAKVFNSADVEQESADNVLPRGGSSSGVVFGDWDSSATYEAGDIVKGSDGNNYISIGDDNTGNNPISSSLYWKEWPFITRWNANVTYALYECVQTSSGNIWKAQTATAGNDPETDDGTNWLPAIYNPLDSWEVPETANFTGVKNESRQIDASSNTVDITLPTLVAGDSFVYHNLITSTFKVQILNTGVTIKGTEGDIAAGTNLELGAGNSVQMVAISPTVLSIVGALL